MVNWDLVFTRDAYKDAKKIQSSGLRSRVDALFEVLRADPFQNPPPYERLVGDLAGAYSRRINIKHRLVYQVYVPNAAVVALWQELMQKGEDLGVAPIGLGARDSLRLEMKYCLYGNDIDETTTPVEAGLSWTVKFDKGDFVGRDVLVRQRDEGASRSLVAFVVEGKGIPRHGYPVLVGDLEVGHVTSGTLSPTLGIAVGMAYVARPHDEIGSRITIDIKGMRKVEARVVQSPLVKR